MHLQHHGGNCVDPLWCVYNQDVNNPAPARVFTQECFTGLNPPFRIVRVNYVIDQTLNDPTNPAIAFRDYVNQAPATDPFTHVDLSSDQVTPGAHQVDVDIVIDAPSFCVGLAGGSGSTSLGVAHDGTPPPVGQSWFKISGSCDLPVFLDIAIAKPSKSGQWCIDVDIVPL